MKFGPLNVHPDYKGLGVGSALMCHSIAEAARPGYRAIIFTDIPTITRDLDSGASRYGVVSSGGNSLDALMAMVLHDKALNGVTGRYIEVEVYDVDPKELAEFDKGYPKKEPVRLLPAELLISQLPQRAKQRNPICSLIGSKAGISLYRVESEGKNAILLPDAKSIDEYQKELEATE